MDYGALNRAILAALDAWVSEGVAPPDSRYPSVTDGTLAPSEKQSGIGFPDIPGVSYHGKVNQLCVLSRDQEPPVAVTGQNYPLLVPTVDADGNEIAGIHSPDVEAPLGTFTGWNIRGAGFAPGALMVVGSFIPFAQTLEERSASGDPRLSIEERYPSHADYVDAVRRAATKLHDERLLLDEDVERYITAAQTATVTIK
jgi:hypothetical protein